MRNKRFPKYQDDNDYTTNSPSYYDDLARKQKLIQLLAEKIWEYDERLDKRLEDLENVLQDYLSQWDYRIKNLDDEVSHIFVTWLNDGTLEQIINHDVLGNKADKTYVDDEIERLEIDIEDKHENISAQFNHTWKTLEHFPRIPPENDDTGRIRRLIEATDRGETAYIPYYDDWLIVSDTIVIDKLINFVSKAKIGYTGSRTKPVFLLDTLTNVVFDIYRLADGNNASDDWETHISGYHGFVNENYVGVEGVNLKWCTIKIYEIRNFNKGVRLRATEGKGYWFNYHYIRSIWNSLIGIELNSDGVGSWFNANYFYDTSNGFNKSQKSFLEDPRTKYTIKQTVTNGNVTGATSNYFYNLKFEDWESAGKHEGGSVQIYLERISDSIFEFRNEIAGKSNKLAVMNMTVQSKGQGMIDYRQETNNILLIDHTTNQAYNKEIYYINTEKSYNPYPNIARLQGHNELKVITSEDSLYSKARKPTDTLMTVKGHVFTGLSNSDYDDIRVRVFGGDVDVDNGELILPFDSFLTITLKDLQKGDTFKVIPKGTNATLTLRVYDKSNTIVDSFYINGVKTLATDLRFNDTRQTIIDSVYSNTKDGIFNFTVNSDDVGSVRVLITGSIKGYEILSNRKSVTVDKTYDDILKEQHYMNAIPVHTINGFYDIGDMVYNTGTGYTDTAGWYLAHTENGLEWVVFSE